MKLATQHSHVKVVARLCDMENVSEFPDYYRILGLDSNSSLANIKHKYHQLSLQHHPDKGGPENNFIQLNQAYKVLSDPNLKQQYDFQYVANINKSSVAVHDNLSLDDLDGNKDGFFTPCRCGGLYQLPVETLKLSIPNLYVSCDTCSLCVLVTIVS